MQLKNYETVFILTPVLSEQQMKDAVAKFRAVLEDNGAEIINVEEWGLRKLAYEIQHKSTGFYSLMEFKAEPTLIQTLETEFRRDERVMRFLTTVLDKYAVQYNEKRRSGKFNRNKENESNKEKQEA
ncbi:small subunit ribosomal protein S6 [Catalinimonas alkaloidigena]|uniref:Small ribosomal subunit protein bS6 n=1 Tax=Catalinimonas alkaloidigena TaxID=1075417 RepID=A0A1G8WL96_9BACT|nr:30S ribosomal protein S6 [Catalinimonas alkaloidigena]SDJ78951.1 small subunit ribosomal protein S6 [Catalinimonas alkaloidigena]